MATEQQFADFVLDQIKDAGAVSTRRMFGEFALYCEGKVVALLCDNQFFLKPTQAGREALDRVVEAPPYPGAKLYFLLDEGLENREAITRLVRLTADALPLPKPKTAKKRRQP